jgi:ureidoglycolate hydrolase
VGQIVPIPLSGEGWAPYGWLPLADTDPADGHHTLAFEWDDAHLNRIAHRRDEVPAVAGGLRCQVLYRHRTHTQVLTPLDAVSVVAVAPPGSDPTAAGAPPIRAFVLRPSESVVLHRGTWHWGPFPTRAVSVELLNVQGRRYREDNDSVDLEAAGTAVDILLPG